MNDQSKAGLLLFAGHSLFTFAILFYTSKFVLVPLIFGYGTIFASIHFFSKSDKITKVKPPWVFKLGVWVIIGAIGPLLQIFTSADDIGQSYYATTFFVGFMVFATLGSVLLLTHRASKEINLFLWFGVLLQMYAVYLFFSGSASTGSNSASLPLIASTPFIMFTLSHLVMVAMALAFVGESRTNRSRRPSPEKSSFESEQPVDPPSEPRKDSTPNPPHLLDELLIKGEITEAAYHRLQSEQTQETPKENDHL